MREKPLWTEKHRPEDFDDLYRDNIESYVSSISDSGMNCIIKGAKGVGKTATATLITKKEHDNSDQDTIYVNVSNIFNQRKKQIKNDDRFSEFLKNRTRMSKKDMINHIIKETASYPPVTGGYKTLILDNMEDARSDFQNSLRRIMEKYTENTQFILISRDSSIIDPIQSRCYTIHISPPKNSVAINILSNICDKEDLNYSENGLMYIWNHSKPNIRKSILQLQTIYQEEKDINPKNCRDVIKDVSKKEKIKKLFEISREHKYNELEKEVDDLINNNGYNPSYLIKELVDVSTYHLSRENCRLFLEYAGDTSYDMTESNDKKIQIINLLARWSNDSN